jgi:hypothetical protein
MATLKTGNWTLNGNGSPGSLVIPAIDAKGNIIKMTDASSKEIKPTAYGNDIIGFWDEDAHKLTFIRVIDKNNPIANQIYTGYLLDDKITIAGSFEAFQGGSALRTVYGWYAKSP